MKRLNGGGVANKGNEAVDYGVVEESKEEEVSIEEERPRGEPQKFPDDTII
jgi:hypothetical protein